MLKFCDFRNVLFSEQPNLTDFLNFSERNEGHIEDARDKIFKY